MSENDLRPVGSGGPLVSPFGLGTMTFGAETDQAEAHRQLDLYVERGGTHVDTADVYGGGEAERIIGRWLRERKLGDAGPTLASKGRFAPPEGSRGASRRGLVRALDASLSRLGVDAVDLYYVHAWDRHTPVEETLDTLSGLVRQGKVHALGWSNLTGWQLQKVLTTARLGGYVVPVALQPQWNLLDRGVEWELLPCCLDEGVGVLPWSPLGGGWLAGKYDRDRRPEGATRLGEDPGRGVEAYDVRNTDRTWQILDVVRDVAKRLDRPMAHVALAWLRDRPGVSSVLLGARTVEQLSSNLDAADLVLDAEDTAALTEVSAPGLPAYPYDLLQGMGEVDHWRTLGVGTTG